jgi:hypothetical protein
LTREWRGSHGLDAVKGDGAGQPREAVADDDLKRLPNQPLKIR